MNSKPIWTSSSVQLPPGVKRTTCSAHEQFRDQAYEIVMAELEGEDERLPLMFRLVVVDGWTVWSADPDVPTVARHFGLTRGQTRYLFEKIDNIIAAVLDAYPAGKKRAVRGGQR
jgi:hypothetical protein